MYITAQTLLLIDKQSPGLHVVVTEIGVPRSMRYTRKPVNGQDVPDMSRTHAKA